MDFTILGPGENYQTPPGAIRLRPETLGLDPRYPTMVTTGEGSFQIVAGDEVPYWPDFQILLSDGITREAGAFAPRTPLPTAPAVAPQPTTPVLEPAPPARQPSTPAPLAATPAPAEEVAPVPPDTNVARALQERLMLPPMIVTPTPEPLPELADDEAGRSSLRRPSA